MKKSIVAVIMGVVALALYLLSMSNCAFPGESAHLIAVWAGLDVVEATPYPLMALFARLFGGGNLLAPVCGALSVGLLCYFLATLARLRMYRGDADHVRIATPKPGNTEKPMQMRTAAKESISLMVGVVAAVVYMLTPAVRAAATHLEPRMFDFTWALVSLALMLPFLKPNRNAKHPKVWVYPLVAGVMAGLGTVDSPLCVAFAPLYIAAIVYIARVNRRKFYFPVVMFALVAFAVMLIGAKCFGLEISELFKSTAKGLNAYRTTPGWLFVALFATLPFAAVLLASDKAYNVLPSLMQRAFYAGLTLIAVLAIATPLAPTAQMETFGILPVASCAFVAVVAGHLASYWWIHRGNIISKVAGGFFAVVALIACGWNLFSFDGHKGDFADEIARLIINDLDGRKWFVTDGVLDDHLRLAARDSGRELNLISLNRDLDTRYLDALAELVREKGVGGSKNNELMMSLRLGVLPFVQDWFAADPSVVKDVAIFGAPDLWYTAGYRPVPERFFFGADDARAPATGEAFAKFLPFGKLLPVENGWWGSYRSPVSDDPVVRLRDSLRRHLGFVVNNLGVYLQDHGRDDEAFAAYDLVLGSIDPDNICAIFNEVEMANAKYPKAVEKKRTLEAEVKKIADDKLRRYYIWRLGSVYGYIRNPDVFVRLGLTWARSGRPGDALSQLRRAIDFVPDAKRGALINLMASIYATETDRAKSRQLYAEQLAKDSGDHDALMGMMRLELMDGNSEKALEYLEAASKTTKDAAAAKVELAMVAMMKNDLVQARDLLKKAVTDNPDDVRAWSMLASVYLQQHDASKDAKERAALINEIKANVIPVIDMHSGADADFYAETTKAFVMLRENENNLKAARDALSLAVRARPDAVQTQDMLLGLDISLNDPATAEAHAREMLRRNREAPLANYVMGSIALGKGEYDEAEAFLRKAVETKDPVPMALNDMAECLRRLNRLDEAEHYARQGVALQPKFYVVWETLGAILLDAKRDAKEAEECIVKACELGKDENGKDADLRIYITLARAQLANGGRDRARKSLLKVAPAVKGLSEFERKEYEDLKRRVR